MADSQSLQFTGERIVPEAANCEPNFAEKMYQEHFARYMFAAPLCSGKSVLDVGCGVGYGAKALALEGAASVLALDLSPESIAHAQRHYAHPSVTFRVDNAEDFVVPNKVDVVVCFELIEHVEKQRQVFQRIERALKPDGLLVMSTPRRLDVKRTHFHTHEFSLGEFEGLILDFFADVDIYFENNHFSSLITDRKPNSVSRIICMKDQFDHRFADYFIAVAARSSGVLPKLSPILTLNDDKYIKLLESDVDILHRAEDDLKDRLRAVGAEHEQAMARAQAERDTQRQERDAMQRALEQYEAERGTQRQERDAMQRALEQYEAERGTQRQERDAMQRALEQYEAERDTQRQERDAMQRALEQGQVRARELLAKEQAEAERQSVHLRQVIATLTQDKDAAEHDVGVLRRMEEHWKNHIQDLEWRLAQADRVASALRASSSWRITAPIRALANMLRRPLSLAYKINSYRRQHGLKETLRVILQRIMHGSAPSAGIAAQALVAAPLPNPTGQKDLPTTAASRAFDVIMLIGCWEGESKRYRVHNVAQALQGQGRRVLVLPFADLREIMTQKLEANTIVMFRSPYEESVGTTEFLQYCRERNMKLVFDIDDLVFDPQLVPSIHGVELLNDSEKALYLDGVNKYRKLLLACDMVTVTTAPLARAVQKLGKPVAVLPNSINLAQIEIAAKLTRETRIRGDRLVVGYFSGSRTHQRDFAQAEQALLGLMEERDDWDLLVVGFLDLGPAWKPYLARVQRRAFLPYLDMLHVLHGCDINLAPLEIGDMFCEAKSELKFFEAALVEVPTIASATEPFAGAIVHGETGMLVRTSEEWRDSLARLLDCEQMRRDIGRAARAAANERFGIEATARAAQSALLHGVEGEKKKVSASPLKAETKRLRIDWIVPRLIIGGGGHRNIIRAAHHLQSFGHDVALHFTSSDDQAGQLKHLVRQHFYAFEGTIKAYDGEFRETDIIFATHWTTVDAALRAKNRTKEIMYFVQDFEPAFAPMGSEYVLAENTYRLGLYAITSGPWCEHMLKRDFGAEADHFRFPVDTAVYRPWPRSKPNTNLVFFAKPEMPRRCFELGAMALAHVHRARPNVELILFGSAKAREQKVGFPATYLEVVPTIQDLAHMYANADAGLVFSTTNPSLVPYEMMACGCPVIDLNRPGNEVNYGGRQDIALLVDPIPENMAREIVTFLDSQEERARRREQGLDFVREFPTEAGMVQRIEELILRRMAAKGHF